MLSSGTLFFFRKQLTQVRVRVCVRTHMYISLPECGKNMPRASRRSELSSLSLVGRETRRTFAPLAFIAAYGTHTHPHARTRERSRDGERGLSGAFVATFAHGAQERIKTCTHHRSLEGKKKKKKKQTRRHNTANEARRTVEGESECDSGRRVSGWLGLGIAGRSAPVTNVTRQRSELARNATQRNARTQPEQADRDTHTRTHDPEATGKPVIAVTFGNLPLSGRNPTVRMREPERASHVTALDRLVLRCKGACLSKIFFFSPFFSFLGFLGFSVRWCLI